MACKECKRDKKHHGRGMCQTCYSKTWRKENPEKWAASMRRYRQRRLNRGLCIECNEPSVRGTRRCEKHLSDYTQFQREYKSDKNAKYGWYQSGSISEYVRRCLL